MNSLSSPDKEKAFEVDIGSADHASSNDNYTPPPDFRLHRELKNRHVAMIRYLSVNTSDCKDGVTLRFFSIGGVIGTGLFLGTGSALMNGGPLGLLLGYIFIGSICYCVMVSQV
jgi:amino acid transporter